MTDDVELQGHMFHVTFNPLCENRSEKYQYKRMFDIVRRETAGLTIKSANSIRVSIYSRQGHCIQGSDVLYITQAIVQGADIQPWNITEISVRLLPLENDDWDEYMTISIGESWTKV